MKEKIKILHIQETIGSGGVERLRVSLAKHLDKTIFEQKFVCTFAVDNIPEEIRAEGHEVIAIGEFKSPFDWTQHRKVQEIIGSYKPDIIHGAVFEGVTMAAVNGWIKKVPYIIIEETSDPLNRSWRGNVLMKLFAKMSDVVIGVSHAVTNEYLLGKLGIAKDKVVLISNGVTAPVTIDSQQLEDAKLKYGIEDRDFVIGSVGRMLSDANKRFSDLIKAFAIFAIHKDHVKLLLVGEGPERSRYEQLAADLNISDKVIFTGYQSNVTLFYKMMDVFSLVSRNEAFGLVLAEAMLNKLPIIATKVGGMKYIVDDQKTGLLVEPFQVNEIAEKIQFLYQNPSVRLGMGEAGLQKALKEYTEEEYLNNIRALYLKSKR